MKAPAFDQIVRARADQRVQKKIEIFRRSVAKALADLGLGSGYGLCGAKAFYPGDPRKVMALLATHDTTKGWPHKLWEMEQRAVSEELLSTMDEMQKALLSVDRQPGEDDAQPASEEVK